MTQSVNSKWFSRIAIALTVVIFLGSVAFNNLDLSKISDVIKGISTTISLDFLIWWAFAEWLWKLKVLHGWLVEIPNLNGTWKGELHSTWIDKRTGRQISPILTLLTIRQTLTKISFVMRTGEMTSRSFSEGFKVDRDAQVCQMTYLYSSEPLMTVQHRSPNHLGAVVLDISQDAKSLSGMYWTQRDTKGTMKFGHVSKDRLDSIGDVFKAKNSNEPKHQLASKGKRKK
ncbi:MAG TPA: hypothetical protein VK914_05755 [bacterium]|jgi:hypothetical protein|nr:hypothetical protein [bacterium]